MTGEPTNTASEMVLRTPAISIIALKVKYPLRFVVSYVQPVTQHYKSRTVRKAPLQSMHIPKERNGATCSRYINYHLKVKYPLRFVIGYVQPVTQQYESQTVRKAPLQSE